MSSAEDSITVPSVSQETRYLPRLNLAIGPNCPVRCEGCYNQFGDTSAVGGLVSAEEIIDFASDVRERDIDGVTLSGGDPLFHPEIVDIIHGLKSIGYRVKLDTVGTALLDDARIIYKGRGSKPQVDVREIKDALESVTLPLDGVNQETVASFRRGRNNLFDETQAIARLLKDAGVLFGFNTVISTANIDQANDIGMLACNLGAYEWHVFEYDSSGPNPSVHKTELSVTYEQFRAATIHLSQLAIEGMRLDLRTRNSRIGTGAYFFVNDAGDAWAPSGHINPTRYGNITRNRAQVLDSYDKYLASFKP